MIINVHVIRNYGPNVVNRGEDGEPKSLVYGGKKRTRVSSQARKHKWRTSDTFRQAWDDGLLSVRTRKTSQIIRDRLIAAGYSEAVADRVREELGKFSSCAVKEIRAYSKADIDAIMAAVKKQLEDESMKTKIANIEAGKKVDKFLDKKAIDGFEISKLTPIDVALFGRMMAERTVMNVPASVYVSHAFSTHESMEDVDFFSATDDLLGIGEEDTGAAHINNISFDTACMYEFAYIDTDILMDNLKDMENKEEMLKTVIETLIPAMVLETPDGKQTTFASRPAPSAVLIEMQDKKTVFDYANAFEEPVWKEPIVKNSVAALVEECESTDKMYGEYRGLTKRLWMSSVDGVEPENATKVDTLAQLVHAIVDAVQ